MSTVNNNWCIKSRSNLKMLFEKRKLGVNNWDFLTEPFSFPLFYILGKKEQSGAWIREEQHSTVVPRCRENSALQWISQYFGCADFELLWETGNIVQKLTTTCQNSQLNRELGIEICNFVLNLPTKFELCRGES